MILINTRNTALGNQLVSACLTIMLILVIISTNPLALIKTKKKPYKIATIDWQPQHTEVEIEQKNKKFAESNPNVPENIPDTTHLISTRNQQAAQENPFPDQINPVPLPKSSGDSENLKIIQATKPQAAELKFPKKQLAQSSDLVNAPTMGETFKQKKENANQDGHHLNSSHDKAPQKTINLTSGNSAQSILNPSRDGHDTKAKFKVRPKLSIDVLNGPTLRNSRAVPKIGKIAIDCRLNPYGVYMQEMLKSIENQWVELISDSYRYIQRDNFSKKITYSFTLLKSGKIERLKEITKSQQTSLSSELCRQAIASRAPFGKWDDSMIQEFGHHDQISITFNYY